MDSKKLGLLSNGAHIRRVPSPYTPSQVKVYLRRISWWSSREGKASENQNQDIDLESDKPVEFDANLANLRTLMFLHTLAFPVDTTDLHYTQEHHMPVTPEGLYEHMVVGHKGSYCFGQNSLFLGMLRGLGYRVYPAAGRVLVPPLTRGPDTPDLVYTPLSHLVLFVQPHSAPHTNKTYVVDVGFGGRGPVRPIFFADGNSGHEQDLPDSIAGQSNAPDKVVGEWRGGWVWGSFPPERQRIIRGAFSNSSLETYENSGVTLARDWHMQVSHSPLQTTPDGSEEWTTLYTFTELEFFLWDIQSASYAVSTLPGLLFGYTLVCMKRYEITREYIQEQIKLHEEGGSEEDTKIAKVLRESMVDSRGWFGRWSIEGSRLTNSIGGKKLEEKTFQSEVERVEILRTVLGIAMEEGAEKWIAGRASAL